ncbi:MAG: REP-associated tyrosine transposase [Dehalococcoidia bacterium]
MNEDSQPKPRNPRRPPPPSSAPAARPAKSSYKRNLPHLQVGRRTLFLTFATWNRWVLPERVRHLVLDHCAHEHGIKYELRAAVVMPDHVHLLFDPRTDDAGAVFGLAEIMSGIKGASAHSVNRALARRGRVWQPESWDTLLRFEDSVRSKAEYICQNPVRAGLCRTEDAYPWLWREWVEGLLTPRTAPNR